MTNENKTVERYGHQARSAVTRGYQAQGSVNLDNVIPPKPSNGIQPVKQEPTPSSNGQTN